MHDYLFCTYLNLQKESFTDGSGQKDRLSSSSSTSSKSSSSSDECGSDKSLLSSLSPPGMPSSSPNLSHYSGAHAVQACDL